MADNYLEKKFEEHLNAPYKPVKQRHAPLKERRAAVVRGAGGIGAAVVRSLRVAGHKVAFCDADEDGGRETALRTGSDYYQVDPTNSEELVGFLKGLSSKWGGVDIIVVIVPKPTEESLLSAVPQELNSYAGAALAPLIASAQFMARERGCGVPSDEKPATNLYGRLVSVCPVQTNGGQCSAMSTFANSVTVSLTKSLSAELSAYCVTVNSISPFADCDGGEAVDCSQVMPHKSRMSEDVAKVVRFLIDESSDFINAENIVVGGGVTRK